MAQPPKPPTSAERRAEANAAAGAAQRESAARQAQESHKQADRLLRGAADARFDALSEENLQLTPEDRRRILKSLAGKEPPRRVVPGGTASRWALIRSRLRYRVLARASACLVVLGAISGLLIARANTPEGVVLSNASQSVPVAFSLKNGQIAFDTLEPDTLYALVRQENGVAVLRRWVPGVGYAEAQVSVNAVHWRP